MNTNSSFFLAQNYLFIWGRSLWNFLIHISIPNSVLIVQVLVWKLYCWDTGIQIPVIYMCYELTVDVLVLWQLQLFFSLFCDSLSLRYRDCVVNVSFVVGHCMIIFFSFRQVIIFRNGLHLLHKERSFVDEEWKLNYCRYKGRCLEW